MTTAQTPWEACVRELESAPALEASGAVLERLRADALKALGVTECDPWRPINQGMPPESQKVVFLWHGMEIEGCWTQSATGKSRIRWHIGRESFSGGSDASPTHYRLKSPPPLKNRSQA